MISDKAQYTIGTKFKLNRKNPRVMTVSDIHRTYNNDGQLVKLRYVATHDFMGQKMVTSDILETSIAMGWVA